MGDEPKFPSPEEAKRKDTGVVDVPPPPRAPVVVTRAEPVPESREPRKPGEKAQLSPEEVRAFLAVSDANRPSKLWRRGKVVAIPTVILSIVAHFVISYWPLAVGGLVIGAVVWTFGPWKRKKDEWS